MFHQLKIGKPHGLQNNNNENIKTNTRLRICNRDSKIF